MKYFAAAERDGKGVLQGQKYPRYKISFTKERLPESGSLDAGYFLCCVFLNFCIFPHENVLLIEPGGGGEWPLSLGPEGAGVPKPGSLSSPGPSAARLGLLDPHAPHQPLLGTPKENVCLALIPNPNETHSCFSEFSSPQQRTRPPSL